MLIGSAASTGAMGEVGKGGAGFQQDIDPIQLCHPLAAWFLVTVSLCFLRGDMGPVMVPTGHGVSKSQ